MNVNLKQRFQEILEDNRILEAELMSRHTTFRIGGPADFFLVPENADEIKKIIAVCMEWCNSCENSRPVAGVWAVCFIWTLARIEAFAFSWRSSASFNLYWLTVCTEIFLQIFLPYGSNLFTDFTDIFPEN